MNEKIYPIDATLSDVVNKKCPILCAMDVIGSKWKREIIWFLHKEGATRYNELNRRIPGITNIMLTKSLREMETDGLICRRELISAPPKVVEYSLTLLGNELSRFSTNFMFGAKKSCRRINNFPRRCRRACR